MLKVKEKRQELGISQEEMARKVGMSLRNYCRTEDGLVEPKIHTADKIYQHMVETAANKDIDFPYSIVDLFREEVKDEDTADQDQSIG